MTALNSPPDVKDCLSDLLSWQGVTPEGSGLSRGEIHHLFLLPLWRCKEDNLRRCDGVRRRASRYRWWWGAPRLSLWQARAWARQTQTASDPPAALGPLGDARARALLQAG